VARLGRVDMIKAQPWRPAVAALSVLSQVIVLSGVFILTAAPAAAADTSPGLSVGR